MPNISTIGNNLIKLSEIDFHEQKITEIASLLIKRRSAAICLLIEAQTLWRQILLNYRQGNGQNFLRNVATVLTLMMGRKMIKLQSFLNFYHSNNANTVLPRLVRMRTIKLSSFFV